MSELFGTTWILRECTGAGWRRFASHFAEEPTDFGLAEAADGFIGCVLSIVIAASIWSEKNSVKIPKKQLLEVFPVIGFFTEGKRDLNGILGNNSSFF